MALRHQVATASVLADEILVCGDVQIDVGAHQVLLGDREVDLKRLEANVTPAEVLPFENFDEQPQLVKGYIGPQGLEGIRYVVAPLVVQGSAWVTGATSPGTHAVNGVMGSCRSTSSTACGTRSGRSASSAHCSG